MSARRNKLAAIVAEALGKEVVTHAEIEAYYAGKRDGATKEKSENAMAELVKIEEEMPEEVEEEDVDEDIDKSPSEEKDLDDGDPEEYAGHYGILPDDDLREELEELTVDVLKDMLREKDLKVTGRKNELIERLIRGEDEDDDE
jgi:hypothetical protein